MDNRRIAAIIYRHLKPTFRDAMRIMDMFYWPLLDILLWGFTSLWLGSLNTNNNEAVAMLLSSLVLWQIVFRSSIEVTRNMLEELWHQNFINLFASPLKLSEWLCGIICISLFNSLWNLTFGACMIYLIFSVNILSLNIMLIPFFIMLLCFGWFCGLIASSVILIFGRRAEMIAWSFPWFFSAFSCVFYPASVLPPVIQKIAWSLPSTYVFESVRSLIASNHIDTLLLTKGFFLNIIFLGVGLTMFCTSFRRAKNRGLNSLD